MVFEANTRNKMEHTMWKGMECCARKWCLFLCTILFEVARAFCRMWSGFLARCVSHLQKKSACYELTYLMQYTTQANTTYNFTFLHTAVAAMLVASSLWTSFLPMHPAKQKTTPALNTMFHSTPYNILAYNCGNTGSKILAQPLGSTANSHSNWTVQQCTNKAPWKNIEQRTHLG